VRSLALHGTILLVGSACDWTTTLRVLAGPRRNNRITRLHLNLLHPALAGAAILVWIGVSQDRVTGRILAVPLGNHRIAEVNFADFDFAGIGVELGHQQGSLSSGATSIL
jgi:hypothetical protein